MKKQILTFVLVSLNVAIAFAQNETPVQDTTPVVATPFVGFDPPPSTDTVHSSNRIHYSATELLAKGKLELTKIFLHQVQSLNNSLPYAAFPLKGQASSIVKLEIPVSNYTQKKRDCVTEKGEKYNETIDKSLYEIIPYSDKNDIIKAILFIQEMVDKLDKGL